MNQTAAALAFFQFEPVPVFGTNSLSNSFVNGLVHVGENAALHQISDNLERLLLELFGQFSHDNGRFDGDDLCVGRQNNLRRGGWSFGRCTRPWTLMLSCKTGYGTG